MTQQQGEIYDAAYSCYFYHLSDRLQRRHEKYLSANIHTKATKLAKRYLAWRIKEQSK